MGASGGRERRFHDLERLKGLGWLGGFPRRMSKLGVYGRRRWLCWGVERGRDVEREVERESGTRGVGGASMDGGARLGAGRSAQKSHCHRERRFLVKLGRVRGV